MTRSKQDKQLFIANLRAAIAALGDGVDVPDSLLASYSPYNCMAILSQLPTATNCAGFHAWRESGRVVRKGAKGLAILVPLGKLDDDAKPVFTWRYVFDISDTVPLDDNSPKLARELLAA
jgi:hypothetical protein